MCPPLAGANLARRRSARQWFRPEVEDVARGDPDVTRSCLDDERAGVVDRARVPGHRIAGRALDADALPESDTELAITSQGLRGIAERLAKELQRLREELGAVQPRAPLDRDACRRLRSVFVDSAMH